MQSAWYIWCVLIYDTLFVIVIFIFAKKTPQKNNHIYQKSFYLSNGNFRHSSEWYFFYLHGFKLNANAWKILHPQNNYIFILILPWNKPILLWNKTKQYNTFWFKSTCSRLYISYKSVSFTRISLSIWLQTLTTECNQTVSLTALP